MVLSEAEFVDVHKGNSNGGLTILLYFILEHVGEGLHEMVHEQLLACHGVGFLRQLSQQLLERSEPRRPILRLVLCQFTSSVKQLISRLYFCVN